MIFALCLLSSFEQSAGCNMTSSYEDHYHGLLETKGYVLMLSRDRNFVSRLSKNLGGDLLHKLAPDSISLAFLKNGSLSLGSWLWVDLHFWILCHVTGNVLCFKAWKGTVGIGELSVTEAEVPYHNEDRQSGHVTSVNLSTLE